MLHPSCCDASLSHYACTPILSWVERDRVRVLGPSASTTQRLGQGLDPLLSTQKPMCQPLVLKTTLIKVNWLL